jgi:adenine phosphoribosyltransferase
MARAEVEDLVRRGVHWRVDMRSRGEWFAGVGSVCACDTEAVEATRDQMRALYHDVSDRNYDAETFDFDGWWKSPNILGELGPLLAEQFRSEGVSVVLGPAASGYLLGPLVAIALGVGFVPVSKHPRTGVDSDPWRVRTTPPDYQDRHLELGFRRRLITSSDRVLAVDDLVDTAGQLLTLQGLTQDAGATWVGATVLIDNLQTSQPRRQLNLHAVFHAREL